MLTVSFIIGSLATGFLVLLWPIDQQERIIPRDSDRPYSTTAFRWRIPRLNQTTAVSGGNIEPLYWAARGKEERGFAGKIGGDMA